MKAFNHTNATSLAEVKTALADGKTNLIAGGTDLIGTLKDNILPAYPSAVINIKTVPGLDFIKEEGGMLKIGAATRLADIAADPAINQKYTALAQAAFRVATPHVRDMGTIGGNIAQLHRCWYFRKPENRFDCIRKGGKTCFAMTGDNRYHSIFGAVNRCIAVNISDTAPALIALDAKVVTDNAGGALPSLSPLSGGVRVLVRAEDAAEALDLLADDPQETASPSGTTPGG